MARVIFDGLSMKQAIAFAKWFEGQGEQDCVPWFEEKGIDAPLVNVNEDYLRVDEQIEEVTVLCFTP